MKLTIDRTKWLRGEGGYESALLRSGDGKMCCVGFYCLANGFTENQITGSRWTYHLDLPEPMKWLNAKGFKQNPGYDEILQQSLGHVNDDSALSDEERERIVARIFAKNSVEVEFIN